MYSPLYVVHRRDIFSCVTQPSRGVSSPDAASRPNTTPGRKSKHIFNVRVDHSRLSSRIELTTSILGVVEHGACVRRAEHPSLPGRPGQHLSSPVSLTTLCCTLSCMLLHAQHLTLHKAARGRGTRKPLPLASIAQLPRRAACSSMLRSLKTCMGPNSGALGDTGRVPSSATGPVTEESHMSFQNRTTPHARAALRCIRWIDGMQLHETRMLFMVFNGGESRYHVGTRVG